MPSRPMALRNLSPGILSMKIKFPDGTTRVVVCTVWCDKPMSYILVDDVLPTAITVDGNHVVGSIVYATLKRFYRDGGYASMTPGEFLEKILGRP